MIRLIIVLFTCQFVLGQQQDVPKLVVGIVVDQMRAEYLYRFQDNYGEDGFKRLLREGFNVKNMHYNYVPTATGPGHASIYTGTTPANHGIVANNWYDRKMGREVYCTEDWDVFLVEGNREDNNLTLSAHSRSPKNLMTTTVTDQLKLFTNSRSKVVGISLKDRGAILPAGHMADYAFWLNIMTGDFVTSSYYSESLPDWLIEFNKRKVADSLLGCEWNFLRAKSDYINSGPDNNGFEKIFEGRNSSMFPYQLRRLKKNNGNYGLIAETPFGNTLLTELAMATILGEKMGKGSDTGFLALSFSSTDYIGHAFGIRSKELEDTYIRLDQEIAKLLGFLDVNIGKDNYLIFLTADHAGSDNPVFLNRSRLPGKFFDTKVIRDTLESKLSQQFGKKDYIAYCDYTQIYMHESFKDDMNILKAVGKVLVAMEGIKEIYVPSFDASRHLEIDSFFRKSYNRDNSGDILLHFKSGWMLARNFGASHSTAYNDDTHVPMLWFGHGIPKGKSVKHHTIDQIAPTLSMLLDIPLPNASVRTPILEVFEK
ncbi:MAG: alkaline phosphatase PafA [Allomuricauda sp.]